ncbi:hypothetical protein Ddc_12169 [Ditylenchus destructor]|nr:hypothetical protein Ddc_12169 [Ditylenchus destructor]
MSILIIALNAEPVRFYVKKGVVVNPGEEPKISAVDSEKVLVTKDDMSKVKSNELLKEVQEIVETKFKIPKGRQLLKDQEDNKIDVKTIKKINNAGAIRAFLDYNVKIIITYAKNKETLEVPFNLETDRLELLQTKVTEKWKLDKKLQTFVIGGEKLEKEKENEEWEKLKAGDRKEISIYVVDNTPKKALIIGDMTGAKFDKTIYENTTVGQLYDFIFEKKVIPMWNQKNFVLTLTGGKNIEGRKLENLKEQLFLDPTVGNGTVLTLTLKPKTGY